MRRVQEDLGREFLFPGADIDAALAAKEIGIHAERAVRIRKQMDIRDSYEAISYAASEIRCMLPEDEPLDDRWKRRPEEKIRKAEESDRSIPD